VGTYISAIFSTNDCTVQCTNDRAKQQSYLRAIDDSYSGSFKHAVHKSYGVSNGYSNNNSIEYSNLSTNTGTFHDTHIVTH
jgi:hypothetical protein